MSRSSKGQAAVELMGMAVIIVVSVMMLWQCALIGYTMFLASRAADTAAREAAVRTPDVDASARGEAAGRDGLQGAWRDGAEIDVTIHDDRAEADASLQVPLILPGWTSLPLTVTASSAATP